jgi:hypothetical protein
MTVTISRLYDNYADAQRAVQGLESAGVPHSDISIVANNSDNWLHDHQRHYRHGLLSCRYSNGAIGVALHETLDRLLAVSASSIEGRSFENLGHVE